MNPEPQNTSPVTSAEPPPPPPNPLNQLLKPPSSHGRNGKVARLPKKLRDQINTMIQDGVPYLKIIETLGPDAAGLSDQCLSTWKAGGYMDWLQEQRLAKIIEAKHELAESIVAGSPNDNAAGQAVLQVLATNLCEFLIDTDPAILRQNLLSDSDKFTRFVNSMVRLAEGGIKCGIYKFRSEDRATEQAKQQTASQKPGISDQSLHTAEEKLRLL